MSIVLTIIYDSFYAMSDVKDDLKLNLKSSIIWFGKYDLTILYMLQSIFVIMLLYIFYVISSVGIVSYDVNLKVLFKVYFIPCFTVLLVLLLFYYQFKLAKTRKPDKCLKAFKNSNLVAAVVFIGLFFEYY